MTDTDGAVSVVPKPSSRRQLGEDGLLIFWRDAPDQAEREGLACILSMCPNPDCACQDVYVDGFLVSGQAAAVVWDDDGVHLERLGGSASRVTLDGKMCAMVDPGSGEIWPHPDLTGDTDPALVDWLASELNAELLEVLHRFRAKAKGYAPEGPCQDIDLDELEKYHLASVHELLEGTRPDEYVLGDRRYWVDLLLCPMPGCSCHQAQIVFFDDGVESDAAADVGGVRLDISGPEGFKIVEMKAGQSPKQLLEDLWARFQQRHDVACYLRRREAQLKAIGSTLWRPVAEPVRVGPKIGRNDPCPCGSGRKYKKCCLGKSPG